MKIVIDIPEEVYEYWKEHKYEYVLSEAIANGIPYEPKGDLISRSAVLEKLMEHQYSKDFCIEHGIEQSIHIGMVRSIIDNAPTVDLWQLRQEATENALKKAEVLYARPQGEWKLDTIGIYCSECKRPTEYSSNFCPNCGAEMRGSAE